MELIGIINGVISSKQIATKIKADIKSSIASLKNSSISPCLGIVKIGEDPASEQYFNAKLRRASEFGVETKILMLESDVSQERVNSEVRMIALDPDVHGVIVESPVPKQLNYHEFINLIPSEKDVDGVTYANLGRLMSGEASLRPATAASVMEFISEIGVPQGSVVAIINRTLTVGKPLSMMLLSNNFTPMVCHSKTLRLKDLCRSSDVIVTAAGKPGLITADFVRPESVVIDVGINVVGDKIAGDADFENIKDKVSAITPVPGGVGSLTSLMIFRNLVSAISMQGIV